MNIKSSLNWAQQQLLDSSTSAKLDAEILLAYSLKTAHSYLYTWPKKLVSHTQQQYFQDLIARRKSGQPIAYILGSKEFWSLNLIVSSDTLIPRPETEMLVEQTLLLITKQASQIADLGTGSGAIALALASENNNFQLTAIDQSQAALEIAQHNASRLNLSNINFVHSNWFESIGNIKFDLIVANPPYVADNEPLLKEGDVRYEPRSALVSGPDGLNAIRSIIKHTGKYLNNNGWLILEHGFEQQQQVQDIFSDSHFTNISCKKDLAGLPRISFAQYE